MQHKVIKNSEKTAESGQQQAVNLKSSKNQVINSKKKVQKSNQKANEKVKKITEIVL